MARTLVYALLLVMGSLAAVTATVAAVRRQSHLAVYATGYASGMAGLWLLSTQGWLPPALSVVMANLLVSWFPLALFVGLRIWLQAPRLWPRRYTAYLACLVGALLVGLTLWPSYQFRAIALAVITVVGTVDVIATVAVSVRHLPRSLMGALATVGAGFLVCNLIKIVLLAQPESAAATLMADTPANVFNFSYSLVFCVVWAGLVLVIDSAELFQVLETQNAQLAALATTDTLTGVGNRQALDARIAAEVDLAQAQGHEVSLLLFDLDHFKEVNDGWGHVTGDRVLRASAQAVVDRVGSGGQVFRWGGEEFLVLVPGQGLAGARARAEDLRRSLETLDHGRTGRVTASFGVAVWEPGLSWEGWLQRADQALYAAKGNGRNRVEVWSTMLSGPPPRVRLEWSPNWASGDPAIDDDHRHLLELANRLLDEALVPSPRLGALFVEVMTHITDHFAAEEAVLAAAGYPGTDQHRARHRELLDQVHGLEAAHARGEVAAVDLFRFVVAEVIQAHLLTDDQEFVGHLRQADPSRRRRSPA